MALPYTFANAATALPLNQLDANFAYLEALIVGGLGSDFMTKANNLSDVASVSTSRTNLGLGTANTPTFAGLNLTDTITMANSKAILMKNAGGVATQVFQKFSDNRLLIDNYDGTILMRPNTASNLQFEVGIDGLGAFSARMQGVGARYAVWNSTATSKWEILNGYASDNDGVFAVYDRTNGRLVWSWDATGQANYYGSSWGGLVMRRRGDNATLSTAIYLDTSAGGGNWAFRGDSGNLDYYYGATQQSTMGTLGVRYLTTGYVRFDKGVYSKGGTTGHHVEAYGAVGDGTTDDQAAILAAMTAAQAGTNGSNTVVLGSKTYKINSALSVTLSSEQQLNIIGEGTQSIIKAASGVNGIIINSGGASGTAGSLGTINFKNFQVLSLGGSAVGITLGTTGDFLLDSRNGSSMENVYIKEFTTGLKLLNMRQTHFQNVVSRFDNTNGMAAATDVIAMEITTDHANSFCGDLTFNACEFISYGASTGVAGAGVKIHSTVASTHIAGIKFQQCNFYYGTIAGVYIYNSSPSGLIDTIMFDQCQFDKGAGLTMTYAAQVVNDDTGSTSDIRFDNIWTFGQQMGVRCTCSLGTMENIMVVNSHIHNHLDEAIWMENVQAVVISDNQFRHIGDVGASQAITMDGNCSQYTITGNVHIAEPSLTSNINYFAVLALGGNYVIVKDNIAQVKGGPTAINDLLGGVTKAVSDNLAYN